MTTITQPSYNMRPAVAVAGQLADLRVKDIISRLCEDATIGFGKPVIQGTADNQAKIATGGVFLGITILDRTLGPDSGDVYSQKQAMAILERGCIWVTAGEAVVAGDAVYRTAAGVLNKTSASNFLIVGAYWETTTANGQLGKIRLK